MFVSLSPEKINFGGRYGCEVSVEAPSYSTAFGTANMSVAVLPHQDPALEGLRLRIHYDIGDILKVNCTSAPSYPPAVLSFLLNHKEVSKLFSLFVMQWFLQWIIPEIQKLEFFEVLTYTHTHIYLGIFSKLLSWTFHIILSVLTLKKNYKVSFMMKQNDYYVFRSWHL